jgi:uncharacterized protein
MSELDKNLRHNKGLSMQRWHAASISRRGQKECFGARSWHHCIVHAALAVASLCLLGASLPQSAIAAQPSFDCAKARSWSEIEVCRDDALAGLDATLASLYRTQKARLDQKRHNALIIDQRQWLVERDNCRFTPSGSRCLTDIYKRRIADLSSTPGVDAGSNSPTAGVPPGQASAPTTETASSAREDRVRAGTARAPHNAEQEEADRRNAAAMADWRRLSGAPMRNRLTYVSGEYGNLAIQAAHLTVMQSLAEKCSTVLRVQMVNGEEGEADWPMLLRLRHRGTIHEKGWFLVSGELLPDSDPQKRDGLPTPTLDI